MTAWIQKLRRDSVDIVTIWWELARIIAPVAIIAEFLMRAGVIAAIAPAFAPLMDFYGLPPELALALLAGFLIGIWNAAVLLFVLVPVAQLSVADVTIFSSLILFAHALPIEQQIIRRAGPGIIISTLLRIGGGLIYAAILHALFEATGWLSEPVAPAWQPIAENQGWSGFLLGLAGTLAMMLVILAALMILMGLLKRLGLMSLLYKVLSPILRLIGIRGEAVHLTVIGLLLGISYGGGLLIREARKGHIPQRQILLSCVFMGFAHSIIEDTLIVVALGADAMAVLVGRLLFAVIATALVAAALARLPERRINALMRSGGSDKPPSPTHNA